MPNMKSFHYRATQHYRNSKGAKHKVAEYFLMHIEESAFMTQAEVAQKIGVSQATVTRYAKEIGYEGYHEMQKAMRVNLRQLQRPAERLTSLPYGEGEASSFDKSLKLDCENIGKLLKLNSSSVIERVVSALYDAHHVQLFASRTSYGAMSFFAYALSQVRPRVTLMSEAEGRLPEQLMDLGVDDLLFIADLPRYALMPIICAKYAQRHGSKIIGVTDSPSSPLVQYSDIVLFVPFESYSFFNSNVATLAMYNGIITSLSKRLKDSSLKRLEHHNLLLNELNLLVMQKKDNEKTQE